MKYKRFYENNIYQGLVQLEILTLWTFQVTLQPLHLPLPACGLRVVIQVILKMDEFGKKVKFWISLSLLTLIKSVLYIYSEYYSYYPILINIFSSFHWIYKTIRVDKILSLRIKIPTKGCFSLFLLNSTHNYSEKLGETNSFLNENNIIHYYYTLDKYPLYCTFLFLVFP